ncbi:hypothetical protein AVEN_66099-1 [Araneus ventricosus]|uniref:Uncharacterized protein n=1 Tax=Araneus ventricosus TaxID=182803 RepID=A0A4Y2FDB3_ARAVE|nr:hypothetical protein AVEN_66099-1 [Araneus ventricosus]
MESTDSQFLFPPPIDLIRDEGEHFPDGGFLTKLGRYRKWVFGPNCIRRCLRSVLGLLLFHLQRERQLRYLDFAMASIDSVAKLRHFISHGPIFN